VKLKNEEKNGWTKNRAGGDGLAVFDGSEREVVGLGIPMWLVNACLKQETDLSEHNKEFALERRYGAAWSSIKDLSQVVPGLLVEVEDGKEKVLIWLK
jgi:hypothetical protein